MKVRKKYDIIIIGGGASGLAAAIEAARSFKAMGNYAHILIIEHLPRVGKKILATGNGRCNLTNLNNDISNFHGSVGFAKFALNEYNPANNLVFFTSLGLYTLEEEGRIYPLSLQASSVLDALRFEVDSLSIEVMCDTHIDKIKKISDGFVLNDDILAKRVILATGGKAAASQGSDGSGFELLKMLGHRVTRLYPALTKLITNDLYVKQLKGVRANAIASIEVDGKIIRSERGELQFTDYGLSGIAVMQLSRIASENFAMKNSGKIYTVLDLAEKFTQVELENYIYERIEKNPKLEIGTILFGIMQKRLAQVIVKVAGVGPVSRTADSLKKTEIKQIAKVVKSWKVEITDIKGFSQAQVTAGGGDTSDFDKTTMQSLKQSGLYACGEILDVDGDCGGYNLQWAWSSGRLAGRSCAYSLMGKI